MDFFLDELYDNENATVKIVHPEKEGSPPKTTVGLIQDDFTLDMMSQFSDASSNMSGDGVDTLEKATSAAANLIGISQRVVKNIRNTLSMYGGGVKPQFNIPLTLINYRADDNIMSDVVEFYAGVSPTFKDGVFLTAPNDYGSQFTNLNDFKGTIKGTWSIQYGNSFRATRLVLLSVGGTRSKVNIKGTNKPLYYKLSLSFQPAVLPDEDEVRGWFLDVE